MLGELLQYDRTAIEAGEFYRLITGHFVHWNLDHFIWDAAVFVALLVIGIRIDRRRTLATLAVASVAIPGVLWFALPEMQTYRGLSGLDSALFALVATRWWRDCNAAGNARGSTALAALGAAFIAKLVYEITTGQTLFVDSIAAGFVPIPLAHLVGGAVGLLWAFRKLRSERISATPASPRARRLPSEASS